MEGATGQICVRASDVTIFMHELPPMHLYNRTYFTPPRRENIRHFNLIASTLIKVAEPNTYAAVRGFESDMKAWLATETLGDGSWQPLAQIIIDARSGNGGVGRFFGLCLCKFLAPYFVILLTAGIAQTGPSTVLGAALRVKISITMMLSLG